MPEVAGHRPHLRYSDRAFILCPEPDELVETIRDDLEDAGCIVLVVRSDGDIGPQLERFNLWKA
jgi:hypothetical protein